MNSMNPSFPINLLGLSAQAVSELPVCARSMMLFHMICVLRQERSFVVLVLDAKSLPCAGLFLESEST